MLHSGWNKGIAPAVEVAHAYIEIHRTSYSNYGGMSLLLSEFIQHYTPYIEENIAGNRCGFL
jgi:hypothetical protein